MISDPIQKIDLISSRNLFLLSGALVIVCQLVAMALVADGQVQKAQQRDLEAASQKIAFVQCMDWGVDISRQGCLREVRAALKPPEVLATDINTEIAARSPVSAMPATFGGATEYGNAEGFALKQVADSQAVTGQNKTALVRGYVPTAFSWHSTD